MKTLALVGALWFATAGALSAQSALAEHRAVGARIALPATWTLDSLPPIRVLEDSIRAWGDSITEARYRFAATTLGSSPVLRARGAGAEGATLMLNYVPGVTLSLLDTLSASQFAEMADRRCEVRRRQMASTGGNISCGAPDERRIGDWRALVSFAHVTLAGGQGKVRQADVVIPMHGAMFFAVLHVPAGDGDVALLERIIATLVPPFTRAGAAP